VSDDGDGDDEEERFVRNGDCDDASPAILLYAAVLPYPDAGDDAYVRTGAALAARDKAAPFWRLLRILFLSQMTTMAMWSWERN
jgi:hypothetical protein